MNRYELKAISVLEKYSLLLFFILITLIGFFVRTSGMEVLSHDMEVCLLNWMGQINEYGGLAALHTQIGNYNIPYQFLLGLISYLPLDEVASIKFVSIFFDFVMAVAAGLILAHRVPDPERKKRSFCIAYALTLFLPTHILNSGFWGQCDSIYVSFILLSLLLLLKSRYKSSFILLGVALAFKLQTVFILPFFLYYYIKEKKFSILHFLLIPAAMYAACLPGFLCGRSLAEPLLIYLGQTDTFQSMTLNMPNLWGLITASYESMRTCAILITVGVLGLGLLYVIKSDVDLRDKPRFLMAAAWVVWTAVLFLPAMHERYAYLLDALLLLLVVAQFNIFNLAAAFCCAMSSIYTYNRFLFGGADVSPVPVNPWVSLLYVAAYLLFTYSCVQACRQVPAPAEEAPTIPSAPRKKKHRG